MSMARPVRLPKKRKFSKFNVRMDKKGIESRTVDDIVFPSKKEAKRYSELKLMQAAGEIGLIERQPRYQISVCGQLICTYVADFRYEVKTEDGPEIVVEDTKGFRTPEYRLKKKLVQALYGIEIFET